MHIKFKKIIPIEIKKRIRKLFLRLNLISPIENIFTIIFLNLKDFIILLLFYKNNFF